MACSERCSDHCINNGPCDHVSGVCSGGCQDGYLGARCFNCKKLINFSKTTFEILYCLVQKLCLWIVACTTGYYGKNCSIPCSPSCNGTCEHIDGSCKICKEGRDNQCSKGSYTWLLKNLFLHVLIYLNLFE